VNAARVSQPINGSNHKRVVLFVAGNELNSRKAKSNLAKLCKEHLGGREFEVVDVLADHTKALQWKVLLTPALLVFSAGSPVRITGNLEQTDRVLSALQMKERGHGA
jgi:circadian clock protein KaiB